MHATGAQTALLVDAHVHLQEEVLEGHVDPVVERACAAGVEWMVCNGTHEGDWEAVRRLSHSYPQLSACFGLHPWFVEGRSPNWLELLEGWLQEGAVGVGEIGLDRAVRERDAGSQTQVLRAQLDLARRRGLPVVIHCVRAWGRLLEVLRDVGPPPAGIVFHAYTGPAELVPPLTRMGGYFSFAGNALDPRNRRATLALQQAPLERLLVETDAPALLPPEPFRPHVVTGEHGELWNEPANLPAILEGLAALRGVPVQELAEITRDNARRLFGGWRG